MSESKGISLKRVAEIFGIAHPSEIVALQEQKIIPKASKFGKNEGWGFKDLPKIGRFIGPWKNFSGPVSIAVFTTKGGVLKSTISLNLARIAALHNIKTCVVGLDIQGDITSALGHDNYLSQVDGKLEELIEKLNSTKGLADLFSRQVRLPDIVKVMDIGTLSLIPETPELAALNDSLANINRREFWLKEKVIDPLKEYFDLIIMDCSPNWNKLTTNALVAADVLISPLECKINNFRNFKVFRHFLSEFKKEMHMSFETIFIPTRYSSNRRLSIEIKDWYQNNVEGCLSIGIKESVYVEEAMAMNQSILEYPAGKDMAVEMRLIIQEINNRITDMVNKREISGRKVSNLHEIGLI